MQEGKHEPDNVVVQTELEAWQSRKDAADNAADGVPANASRQCRCPRFNEAADAHHLR